MAKACCLAEKSCGRRPSACRCGEGIEHNENHMGDDLLFAMVGNPNVGKTTLINAISGSNLKIGNWPGTTVERMDAHFVYHCLPEHRGDSRLTVVETLKKTGEAAEDGNASESSENSGVSEPDGAAQTAAENTGTGGGTGAKSETEKGAAPACKILKAELLPAKAENSLKPAPKGAFLDNDCPLAQEKDKLGFDAETDVNIHLVDLPGAYGLSASSAEEQVTRDELLTRLPDAVIDVVDAGNLERNLALTIELLELGIPVIIAFNLLDEARAKGMRPNIEALSRALDVPVIPTVAVREEGVGELIHTAIHTPRSALKVSYPEKVEKAIADLASYLDHPAARWIAADALIGDDLSALTDEKCALGDTENERKHTPLKLPSDFKRKVEYYRKKFAEEGIDCFLEIADSRYRLARKLAELGQEAPAGVHKVTEKLDNVVLHPWLGVPVFLLCMFLLFRFTFLFSDPWVEWCDTVKQVFMGWTAAVDWLPPTVRSFIMDGVLEGVGTVAAFTPVLFVLYIGISFLESSGFLARAAFLIDRVMKGMNLPGKAFIAMLVGFGCNVPGIIATKTLDSVEERLRVSMAIPFAPCSARIAVFVFFAAAFFPAHASIVTFALFLTGLIMGLLTILLMGKILRSGDTGSIMELPSYRIPTFKIIWKQASARTVNFLESAGGVILLAVIAVWVINSFPAGAPENTYFAQISRGLVKFTSSFGVDDWHLAGGLLPGFVAKEVVVGTLAVTYAGTAEAIQPLTLGDGLAQMAVSFVDAIWETLKAVPGLLGITFAEAAAEAEETAGLAEIIVKTTTPAAAFAYMIYVLLYMPCVGTIATLKNEFGWKWTAFSCIYSLIVAWILAVISYHAVGWLLAL
ncbi:ferrous iron transport protein B [bacterium]|nr:ferrous iron transport protein B [bacterium]